MEKIRVLGLAVSLGVVALTAALALKAGPAPDGADAAAVEPGGTVSLVPTASAAEPEDLPPGGLTAVIEGKRAGLFVLEHTEAKAEVSGGFAFVEVTQRFKNPHPSRLEAIYAFPLPENAAVTDLFIRISSRVVQSEVRKREEAKAIYETAKSSGRVSALLEQERPNLFTQSVANIPPGETVLVHIRYAHELNYEEGATASSSR